MNICQIFNGLEVTILKLTFWQKQGRCYSCVTRNDNGGRKWRPLDIQFVDLSFLDVGS